MLFKFFCEINKWNLKRLRVHFNLLIFMVRRIFQTWSWTRPEAAHEEEVQKVAPPLNLIRQIILTFSTQCTSQRGSILYEILFEYLKSKSLWDLYQICIFNLCTYYIWTLWKLSIYMRGVDFKNALTPCQFSNLH